jgi:hypothetical protein
VNFYRYVRNRPINLRDPSGRDGTECNVHPDSAHCKRWQIDCSVSCALIVGAPCTVTCSQIPALTPQLRAAKIGCYAACAAAVAYCYYECMEANAPACKKW